MRLNGSSYNRYEPLHFWADINHKIYISHYEYVRSLTEAGTYVAIEIKGSPNWLYSHDAFVARNKWERISFINLTTDSSNHYLISIVGWNTSNDRNVTSFSYNAYFDNFIAIDLTKAFGAGNEPSKEWCDANIEYFDGSKTIIYHK